MDFSLFAGPELYAATIRVAVPIALAAVGATLCEKSGVMNIGLEGMMLAGAFAAVGFSIASGNAAIGVTGAIVIGGCIGALLALAVVVLRADQIVAGIAVNVLALGTTGFLTSTIFGSPGLSPEAPGLGPVNVAILSGVPWIGEVFFKQTPIVYATLFLALGATAVLFLTPLGLRLAAAGHNPQALTSAGVSVPAIRIGALTVSGMLAGLAGANLALEVTRLFVFNMTGGRGFIALAANILGGWNPIGSVLASLLFGFADALGLRQSQIPILPHEFMLALPYVLTVLVLALSPTRAGAPRALGRPLGAER